MLVLNLVSYVSYDYNINLKIAFLCFIWFYFGLTHVNFCPLQLFKSLLNIVMDANVHEYSMVIVIT